MLHKVSSRVIWTWVQVSTLRLFVWHWAGDLIFLYLIAFISKMGQYYHLLKGLRGGTDEITNLKHSAYDLHIASSQYYLLKKFSENKSRRAELWNFQHYPPLWSFILKITSSRITEEGRDQLSNFTLRKRHQNNLYIIMESITRNKRCHR